MKGILLLQSRRFHLTIISMMIDDDIDDIITRGETRTAEISAKYQGLNLEDLNNFKSEMTVQKWEGEDFGGKVVYLFIPGSEAECIRRRRRSASTGSSRQSASARAEELHSKATKQAKLLRRMPRSRSRFLESFRCKCFKSKFLMALQLPPDGITSSTRRAIKTCSRVLLPSGR